MAKQKRFVTSRNSGNLIICYTDTGVQYLFVNSGYGGGLTVLVDRDGKPLLSPDYPNKQLED